MGVVLEFRRPEAAKPVVEDKRRRPLAHFDAGTLILAYGRLMSGWQGTHNDTLMRGGIERELLLRGIEPSGFINHLSGVSSEASPSPAVPG